MIFTREINGPLTSLVKKLDAEVGKSNKKMGAFIVLLSDDEDAAVMKLKELHEKEGIKHVSFTADSIAGPPKYKVAKDAAVTVVLYKKGKVAANHAFKKGDFDSKDVDEVVSDLDKIAP
jgi:hypothetical protein